MSEQSSSPKKKRWRWVVGVVALSAFTYNVATNMASDSYKKSCLESETLRVEIGGNKYAFPRKMISSLRGADVVNAEDLSDKSTRIKWACQKTTDAPWIIDEISINLNTKPCPANDPKCDSIIFASIEDINARRDGAALDVYPKTKRELLEKCGPPPKPFNETVDKYWWPCRYMFQDSGLSISIQFTGGGGIHPPEKIEETKAMVVRAVMQYRVK